ncbi:NO-inducible flavohemoprotein [Bacillus sp. ISL-4]|uniref:NO-inducible flavohemoprotein n=1 Tax=Bacillus sp. ISL-4 TaxID=2819125 RepID=UPI001BE7ED1B|nr:NO-inducible flavohemoprotein [Bacillus sp. ISL-4]MBT2664771.1 NO-inducible flavohemoprotein [Bacillus sp. ISL-4]MBT2671473.1 NO-inducible flavohemoprotein [Streptomyces sp. ISL-14]
MLDAKTIEIVQSTAPVLKEHSKPIGKRFYEILFSKAPDLYNLFNQTNQKRGIQQEALGYAVYAAGEHISNLEAIKPVIKRVTEKHRAIGVKPEQYPVVGETLLQAVKDVLGDTATDEIIEAWGKAYGYIADAFIDIEKNLYEETEHQPGGWEGYRNFNIDKKIKESDVVTSFYLKPTDGKPIASYHAGQYLTLKAEIPGEKYTHIRHYSLSDSPGKDYYRISVKREDAHGDAPSGIVSNYLHKQLQVGDTLQFSAPAGDFELDNTELPVVLISGGIGITPLLSMLNTIIEKQPQRQVTFIHATSNSQTHAFKDHLQQIVNEHQHIKSYVVYGAPTEADRASGHFDKEGYVGLDFLQSIVPSKEANFYFCGPIPFMEAINEALNKWSVSKDHIHYEVFSPLAILGEK